MDEKNKITLYTTILPVAYLAVLLILGLLVILPKFRLETMNSFLMILSFLVFASGFPVAISMLFATKILDTKHPKLVFIITPIIAILLSIVLIGIFINLLNSEWYIGECCGPCDFGGPKFMNVILVGFTVGLNILNIIFVLALSGVLYRINKKIL